MQVREIMTTDVQSVSSDTDLVTVARYMRDLNVGSIPVVEGEQLIGIITDRDIVIRVLAEGRQVQQETVGTHVTPNPTTITPDQNVNEAAQMMAREQIRRLPVVEGGRLIGWLSLGDIAVESGKDKVKGDTLEQISYPSEPQSRSAGQ